MHSPLRTILIAAHRALIEEIAEIQQREALRSVLPAGSLPLRTFMRTMEPRQQALARADDMREREAVVDRARLSTITPIVRDLEARFAEYHHASDAAWGEAMADYIRRAAQS